MKNSMDRRVFWRLGLLERPRWPPARVAAKRFARPRPTRAPRISYARPHWMKITIVSMGAMRTSEPRDLPPALTRGSTIDTARGYMDDATRDVGEALKGYRDRVYVATKVKLGSKGGNDPEHRRKSFLAEGGLRGPRCSCMRSAVEQVMNTEYREVLAEAKKSGKTRFIA